MKKISTEMPHENARVYNFSSGPGVLPVQVLERAQRELIDLDGQGMSVMEMSHRSSKFQSILEKAGSGLRSLLNIPDDFHVLFLQGGAALQFSMVPMNLLGGKTADYIVTGAWGEKAVKEAGRFGSTRTIFDGSPRGFRSAPEQNELSTNSDAAYLHYTSNETIDGVEFPYDIDGRGVPVVCDASSNILSKPIDIEKYDLIYAGAQKNIGPSGVTVVIVRKSLLERVPSNLPTLLNYRSFADNDSMPNTPNTFGIYMIGLVCDWLEELGGVEAIAKVNAAKAKLLYDAIDSSDGFYIGHADRDYRSRMNVTFRLQTPELDDKFCTMAEQQGMSGLRGHRSVGGIRASIYNAFPVEGVEKLVDLMSDFSAENF